MKSAFALYALLITCDAKCVEETVGTEAQQLVCDTDDSGWSPCDDDPSLMTTEPAADAR